MAPMSQRNPFFCATLLLTTFFASTAAAQVVVSGNVQLLYDDNIYLEDDRGLDPAFLDAIEALPPEERDAFDLPQSRNGDPDSDFITNASVGIAAPFDISPHIQAGTDTTLGFSIFSSETDETRLNLDAKTLFRTRDTLLPQPFFAEVSSNFSSGQSNVGVADGSAARQSQNHDAEFRIGADGITLGRATDARINYLLRRHDFLGEFTFGNRDNREVNVGDQEVFTDEEQGSDYFLNRVEGGLDHFFSQTLIGAFTSGVEVLTFTNIESRNALNDGRDESDFDRINYDFRFEVNKIINDEFRVSGSVGGDFTYFTNSPGEFTRTIVGEDGTLTTEVVERDRNENSLSFSGDIVYTPLDRTAISVLTSQSSGINIDGERLTVRTVAANVSQGVLEDLNILASGRFTQFDQGDSLSDSTDRFEVSLSAQYPLAESLVVSAGWNYVDQSAQERRDQPNFLADNIDYQVNRAFVSISGGLIGLTR